MTAQVQTPLEIGLALIKAGRSEVITYSEDFGFTPPSDSVTYTILEASTITVDGVKVAVKAGQTIPRITLNPIQVAVFAQVPQTHLAARKVTLPKVKRGRPTSPRKVAGSDFLASLRTPPTTPRRTRTPKSAEAPAEAPAEAEAPTA